MRPRSPAEKPLPPPAAASPHQPPLASLDESADSPAFPSGACHDDSIHGRWKVFFGRPSRFALALTLLTTAASAQTTATWKLHRPLPTQLAEAEPDAWVPVYFVIADRLGYPHWFPRVEGLPLDERRALVIAELQAHAARTQKPVLDRLRDAVARGEARDLRSNWLGNFVAVRAHRDVIEDVAALSDVSEVWSDATPDGVVEDGAVQASATAPPMPPGVGNGPAAVGADRVWALGLKGQGVVVMNADAGINVQHLGLRNRLWLNPGEVPANGVDDDGNGFVDDVHGWAFDTNTADLDDNGSHGTATAGVLVADATCNNTTYGIAPKGQVMTGKILTESSQWDAIQYALLMGADIQTSSYSYKNDFVPPPNYAMHRDVGEATLAAGLFRTNSTSNNGYWCNQPPSPLGPPFNIAAPGCLPAPWIDPNQTLVGRKGGVIGVGAYTLSTGLLDPQSPCGPFAWYFQDLLALIPSYPPALWDLVNDNDYPWIGGTQLGLLKPDVIAPAGTLTTVSAGVSCNVATFGGTSNATPIVAGCAMLWKCANKSLLPEDIAMILHLSSQDVGVVPGKENRYGAGKVDAYEGLLQALCVQRVDGEPAWQVWHRSGTPITWSIDGSANRPALIAVGVARQTVSLGAVTSGIGTLVAQVFAGSTDAQGDVTLTLPVAKFVTPLTLYSQAFLDDRAGVTGRILSSNVIGITVVP